MLSSHSIQLIFSSWDVIKHIPGYAEMFSNQLSEKLEDSTVAEWFSGPANPHHMVFVKMIDLVVHLLGPDLDVIVEELISQGRRHHRYHSDMAGFFHADSFGQITVAFIEILSKTLQEQSTKESNLVLLELKSVKNSWSDFFTMIRAIMKQGVKIEVRRHRLRAEKKRQDYLVKQERLSDNDSCSTASSHRVVSQTFGSTSQASRNRRESLSLSNSLRRNSSTHGLTMKPLSLRSARTSKSPIRSKAGVRAGLALLNAGSEKNKSSKLSRLAAANRPKRNGSLRNGIRSTMSIGRNANRNG